MSPPRNPTEPRHWLVKQEPESYSWEDFRREGATEWSGVRNYQARNNLKAMHPGDPVLFYESGEAKEVVGMASVAKAAYPDPTADEPGWVAVRLKAGQPLRRRVALSEIRADPALSQILLLRNSRLSVIPLSAAEYARIVRRGG